MDAMHCGFHVEASCLLKKELLGQGVGYSRGECGPQIKRRHALCTLSNAKPAMALPHCWLLKGHRPPRAASVRLAIGSAAARRVCTGTPAGPPGPCCTRRTMAGAENNAALAVDVTGGSTQWVRHRGLFSDSIGQLVTLASLAWCDSRTPLSATCQCGACPVCTPGASESRGRHGGPRHSAGVAGPGKSSHLDSDSAGSAGHWGP
jgi:hypothetical protein